MSTKCRLLKKNRVFYGRGVILAMTAALWTNNANAQVLPVAGACCLPNGSCIITDDCDCKSQCGVFSGPGTICGFACPIAPSGAGCLP